MSKCGMIDIPCNRLKPAAMWGPAEPCPLVSTAWLSTPWPHVALLSPTSESRFLPSIYNLYPSWHQPENHHSKLSNTASSDSSTQTRVGPGSMSLAARQLGVSRSAFATAQKWSPGLLSSWSGSLNSTFGVRGAGRASEAAQRGQLSRPFATMEKQREPQVQDTHPGKEHEMDPVPQHKQPQYKGAAKLEGRIALVTGGDSGIGRAVGHHFALEGATVAFTYLPGPEDKDADDTIDILKKAQTANAEEPLKIGVDLGFDENCKKVIDQVVEKYGRIDILVNNAGEQHTVENIEDLTPEQLERTFRTNIFSMFYLVRHALPHMKEGSAIVNSTSVNAFKGNATLLDYTATKGAILAFTRGLALQLVKRGIRVNAVAPGPVWTPLIPSSFAPEKTEKFGGQVPMGRAGEPSEIATSYVFLASNDASYFTGQCLHPNGGYIVNA